MIPRSHRRPAPQWVPRLVGTASAAILLVPQGAARAEVLYRLESLCSLNGTEAVPCQIEAINAPDATEYRHALAGREVRFRVVDAPTVRVELWDAAASRWRSARNASAFFALNAVCLDGTSFCAINPNYLNSVRQDLGRAADGRSVLEVHFGADGRIDASCYDTGCPDGGRLPTAP